MNPWTYFYDKLPEGGDIIDTYFTDHVTHRKVCVDDIKTQYSNVVMIKVEDSNNILLFTVDEKWRYSDLGRTY